MVATVNDPDEPAVKVVLAALVNAVASFTVSVNDWPVLPVVLVAVMVKLVTPPVPAAGVPLRTPVVAFSVSPLGRAPTVTA